MSTYPLAPHWSPAATWVAAAFAGLMGLGSVVAMVLRVTANSDRGRALARDFGVRVIGWWILLLVVVPGVLSGGVVVLVLLGVAALVAWHEFVGLNREAVFASRDLVWVVPLVVLYFGACLPWRAGGSLWLGGLLGCLVWLGSLLFPRSRGKVALWRTIGWMACVVPLGCAALIELQFGTGWLAFVLIIAQLSDVLQYVFGKAWGRHRLAPTISPGKTWEGLLGGLLSSLALGFILAPIIHQTRLVAAVLGGAFAVAGALMGLAMSAAKRSQGAKDFGHWLPGHGGLMDRFDSLCGAALAAYLWLRW